MSDLILSASTPGSSPFDSIRLTRPDGTEYWSARDLMKPLGYRQWRQFSDAVERAQTSCVAFGEQVADHFAGARKVMEQGRWKQLTVDDLHLTRYACYLTAMNSDARKQEVAAAQAYFIIQTRRAELPRLPQDRPWVERFGENLSLFRCQVNEKHLDRWAIAPEIAMDLVQVEDVFLKHSIPLLISDSPDGSVGLVWSYFRRGKSWAVDVVNDVPLLTPGGFTVFPNLYRVAELMIFRRWFTCHYLPEQLPEYLTRKAARDAEKWQRLGYAQPSTGKLVKAADGACRHLTGQPARLPQRLARPLALENGPKQSLLF